MITKQQSTSLPQTSHATDGLVLDHDRVSLAQAPSFARKVLTTEIAAIRADGQRYDELAGNAPGLFSFLASASQKAVWEKEKARMAMEGQARCERLRIGHEVTLRILATTGEALVKSAQVGIAREFFAVAHHEVLNMAVDTEVSRKRLATHVMDREATLATLPARMKGRYEQSLDNEVAQHLAWLDQATAELLEKLQAKVVSYAGRLEG